MPSPSEIQVSPRGRSVRVRAADLFSADAAQACCGFLSRVFCVGEVCSIHVDYRRRAAVIHYAREIPAARVLERMAAELCGETRPDQDRIRSLLPRDPDGAVTIYRHGTSLTTWEVLLSEAGTWRVRHSAVNTSLSAHDIGRRLDHVPGIRRTRWHWFLQELEVEFDASWEPGALLALLDGAVYEASEREGRASRTPRKLFSIEFALRLLNLGLAGVSFLLAIAGALLPLLPTAPFLLLTGYFLARSSPQLYQWVLRRSTLGWLLRDWQQHRGMRWNVKVLLLVGAVAGTFVAVLTAASSPGIMVGMLLLGVVGVYMILSTPTVSEAV